MQNFFLSPALMFGLLLVFLLTVLVLSVKCVSGMRRCRSLEEAHQNSRIARAHAEDNFNIAQDCLATFASKVYGKSIPTYGDGMRWRPGDFVMFRAVLGGNEFKGEVEVNIDGKGMMLDRCPVTVRVLKEKNSDADRYFGVEQITDVVLVHRPEYFQEELARTKD